MIRRALEGAKKCCCYLCGRDLTVEQITLDHVKPKAAGGGNSSDNLRICCRRCNMYRATMPVTYWRMLRGFITHVSHPIELQHFAPHNLKGSVMTHVIRDAWSKV